MAAPKPPVVVTPPIIDQEIIDKAEKMITQTLAEFTPLIPIGPNFVSLESLRALQVKTKRYRPQLMIFFKKLIKWLANSPTNDEIELSFIEHLSIRAQQFRQILWRIFDQIDLYAANDKLHKIEPEVLEKHVNKAKELNADIFKQISETLHPSTNTFKSYGKMKTIKPAQQARFVAFGDYNEAYYDAGANDIDYYLESEFDVYDDGMNDRYYIFARNGDYGGLYNEYDNGYRYDRKLGRNGDYGRRQRKLLEVSENDGFMQDPSGYTLITALCIGLMILFCIIGGIIYRRRYTKKRALKAVKMSAMNGVEVKADEEESIDIDS